MLSESKAWPAHSGIGVCGRKCDFFPPKNSMKVIESFYEEKLYDLIYVSTSSLSSPTQKILQVFTQCTLMMW